MRLIGANPATEVVGEEELPGKVHYFRGADPAQWRPNVRTYAKVRYREVYDGIDVLYYGIHGQVEYGLVIAPGADPSVITLGFDGADDLTVDVQGDLLLRTAAGRLRMRKPRVYQETRGEVREISSRYVRKAHRRVGFQVAAYDASRALVIDPLLAYSTYLGGGSSDSGFGIAVDANGNAYITGVTVSPDFPTRAPLDPSRNDEYGDAGDAFVTKLNANGSLVYSTYLGGSSFENSNPGGIAVDAAGNAYVTGETYSADFPTVNPIQAANRGAADVFVAKLNPSGSALIYSTYLGGSGFEAAPKIAVDSGGNAYVTGSTNSPDFPTASPLQGALGGYLGDAFVAKLNSTGSALVYSTYLGGSGGFGYDAGAAIAADSAGNAYVAGVTNSTDFPIRNALQAIIGGAGDAFVTKLNPTGSALMYSTYLGGSNNDYAVSIAVDVAGNAYITGFTGGSADFPTKNALYPIHSGGGFDAFVAKLSSVGGLVYSTYLGGSENDQGHGIAVDLTGAAYLTGLTSSIDFPRVNPLQAAFGGGEIDAFVAKLNPDGSALVYSTYLGGSLADRGFGIAVDAAGSAYIAGATASANFPAVAPLQAALRGGTDAFVAKISTGAATVRPRFTVHVSCPPTARRGATVDATVVLTNSTEAPRTVTRGALGLHVGELHLLGPRAFVVAAAVPPGEATIVTVSILVPAQARSGALMSAGLMFFGHVGSNRSTGRLLGTARCTMEVVR